MIRTFRLLWLILRRLHLKGFLIVLLSWYVIGCLLLWGLDPAITNVGDAFWFGFILVTTIGFGDFTVTTWAARLVAALLGVYGDFAILFLTGVVTSWFCETFEEQKGKSLARYLDQLEHLDELDDESLRQVAEKTRSFKKEG